MNLKSNRRSLYFLLILALMVFQCAKDDVGFIRNNPFDAGGENWNPPVVEAMPDTTLNINDSLIVIAAAHDDGTIEKYLWVRNGSKRGDTTDSGSLKVAYADSGRHVVRVKVIDDDGITSQPDSCIVIVTLDRPEVEVMADTMVNINDTLTVTATARDNGTVKMYLWARNGSKYADTTDSGSLKVAYADSGRHVVRVKVIDDDVVASQPDSCVFTVTLDSPVVTAYPDTTVSFTETQSVTVSVTAEDANASGKIDKYYWSIGENSWTDSTAVASYTVTTTTGEPVVIRWAVRDDDGVFSKCDTFTVCFNRPPKSATLMAPISRDSWTSFNWSTGKGSLPVKCLADDPYGAADSITYTLYTGISSAALSLAFSGKDTIGTLPDIDSSSTVYYRLVALDLFGDSAVSTGSFVAPPPLGALDADGNFYPAVVIGNQVWTTVNLRTTKYNDGTAIPHVTDETSWSNLNTPGYCFYNNSSYASYQEKWGALYNWYAVSIGKLAPAGWHVSTDAEWDTLATYLGGLSVAGGKMKEAGTANWSSPNTGATNSSGFSALPGGNRHGIGDFGNQSSHGSWWSPTENDASGTCYRDLLYTNESLHRFDSIKGCGFSVRLVRD